MPDIEIELAEYQEKEEALEYFPAEFQKGFSILMEEAA